MKGKRAIVLAASRGLGYDSAMELAHEGCDLLICSRHREQIEIAAAEIRHETGARVHPLAIDLSREEALDQVVASCMAQYGGVEIAIHNAGTPGDCGTIVPERLIQSFDLNLMSFVRLVQAAIPEMRKSGYGRIFTFATTSPGYPMPNLVLTTAMKTGILGLTRHFSTGLAIHNILVDVLTPGRRIMERINEIDLAVAAKTGRSVENIRQGPLARSRLENPRELLKMISLLASDPTSPLTGPAIPLNEETSIQ